jgi:ribosomal protection tetracycline resistance protein
MPRTLNLGVLAHVDAGKTSLTERILFDAGVIRTIGDVDHGTTQTDTLVLERQRGITIQSAVVSFRIDHLTINLIDTPGHPDFIAEVERALGVLDAVILVISAVEGVQPQTRRLSRAIANLGLPCLIFVNKIDRMGARSAELVDDIAHELRRDLVVLSDVTDIGTRDAVSNPRDPGATAVRDDIVNVLSRYDDGLLDRFVKADGALSGTEVTRALREQVSRANVTPVLFGSAMTGAGIPQLFDALAKLGPIETPEPGGPLAAEVFKVQRQPNGERVLFCRIWRGTMAVRNVVPVIRPHVRPGEETAPGKITGIDRFRDGHVDPVPVAAAGDIVRVHGLSGARIGDWIGSALHDRVAAFDPPVFESRVEPAKPDQRVEMNAALADLADQDPLISVRRNETNAETYIHMYGEVQREVIEVTMRDDHGVPVTFGDPTVLHVERLLGNGHAAEIFGETAPPFYATVGFRVAPKRGERSTWTFTPGKAKQGFFDAAEEGGRSVLGQGLYGWPVVDWDVEVTDLIYLVSSVASDYRKLAMLVMADAIRDAGTVVCEPVHEVRISAPPDAIGAVIHLLTDQRGALEDTLVEDDTASIIGAVPTAGLDAITRYLPGVANGRADVDSRFRGYVPVTGEPPVRARIDLNPFNRAQFLSRLSGRF